MTEKTISIVITDGDTSVISIHYNKDTGLFDIQSTQREYKRVSDDDEIKMIRSIIESLDIPNKKNIKDVMHKELGMNERTTDKLLMRYRDIEWEMKISQREGSVGRPNLVFKCITKD